MRKEIEDALLCLQIEARDTRKRTLVNVGGVISFAVFFYSLSYNYLQYEVIGIVDFLIIFFGGIYIAFEGIPTLYHPLKAEFRAFQKLARATQILEKSDSFVTREEAYRCVKHAHRILAKIELKKDIEWYDIVNKILEQFFENLQLRVLPAIISNRMKTEHLEDIALAMYNINPLEVEAINKKLEAEPTYTKIRPPPSIRKMFVRKIIESRVSRIACSLALGYGVILLVCLVYVVTTQQDLMIFARENPTPIILGGATISGITVALWTKK